MKLQFKDNSGSAIVEIALVSPLFLLMLLGGFELGRVAHFTIEVQNAAHAGAAYGSQNSGTAGVASQPAVTQAAQNDAPDVSGLTATPGNACVCETLTTGSDPTYAPSSGTISCSDPTIIACSGSSSTVTYRIVSYATVTTQATINPIFNVSGLPGSYTLHGYSAMRVLPN
jgi:Flp pilus assembly protein TadG